MSNVGDCRETAMLTRRDFLKLFGAACATTLVGGVSFAQTGNRPIEMLVVGDSFVWGQGLREEQKIYSLVADAMRRGDVGPRRDVNVMVKAHSGSTIRFNEPERTKYNVAGRKEEHPLPPEVNVGFPSMWRQVEIAVKEYKTNSIAGADLIIVSGGITDIAVTELLNPYSDINKLPELIAKYCRDEMRELMRHMIANHPNAQIVVLGYFPIIVEASQNSRLLRSWLESMKFPRFFQPIINNPASRRVFFSRIKQKSIERSRMWHELSTKELAASVELVNRDHGPGRAIFVPSPLRDEHAAETPNTKLFRIKNNGTTEDPLYEQRKRECRESLAVLKRETKIDHPVRNCEIAAIAHPNPEGSRMYAEAVIDLLPQLIRR